jgi:uncharacterized protein (DUF779 family)
MVGRIKATDDKAMILIERLKDFYGDLMFHQSVDVVTVVHRYPCGEFRTGEFDKVKSVVCGGGDIVVRKDRYLR